MGADFHRMATTANLDAHSLHDVVDARCCVHLKSPMGIQINRSVDVSGLCHTRPPRSANFSLRAMFSLNKVMNCSNTPRSEEHTSELQSLMRNSYAVFCLQKKNNQMPHAH